MLLPLLLPAGMGVEEGIFIFLEAHAAIPTGTERVSGVKTISATLPPPPMLPPAKPPTLPAPPILPVFPVMPAFPLFSIYIFTLFTPFMWLPWLPLLPLTEPLEPFLAPAAATGTNTLRLFRYIDDGV